MFLMPMMFVGPILWVVLIGLIVWAVMAAAGKKKQPWQTEDTALEILEKSYARGEISRDEFETRKKEIV